MRRKCSICQKVIKPADEKESRKEKFYPFCSMRCKFVDLGRWLDGKYRIATKPEDEEDESKTVDNSGKTPDNDNQEDSHR
jgi:endogenous inhibitor of DNA gyrase (YacG/DUF329 family)